MDPFSENNAHWEEPGSIPELIENQVIIWRFDPRSQFPYVNHLVSFLSDEERARMVRFVDEHARRNFVICRGVLHFLLMQAQGANDGSVHIREGRHGKPELAAHAHSVQVQFNLTHTEGLCLIALSRNLEVGIDVERVEEMDELPRMARSYLAVDEYQSWLDTETSQRNEKFYDHWCAKEAVLKAAGSGLSIHPARINIQTILSGRPISGVQEDGYLFELQDCRLFRLPLGDDLKGWLAVLGEPDVVSLYDLADHLVRESISSFTDGMNVEK